MKCEICGKEIEKSSYSSAILCSSECFGKHFWNEIVKDKNNRIIINGNCYVDGGNKPNAIHTSWLGFEGIEFAIETLEKQEPKVPITIRKSKDLIVLECPNCGRESIPRNKPCWWCGQALDWSST